MRLWVRPGGESHRSPPSFHGTSRAHRTATSAAALPARRPLLAASAFGGRLAVNGEREPPPGPVPSSSGSVASPPLRPLVREFWPASLSRAAAREPRWFTVGWALRTDSLTARCNSRETLVLFSPRRSIPCNCYFNQDLHHRPFDAPSQGTLRHNRRALLHSAASHPPPRLCIGGPLERH